MHLLEMLGPPSKDCWTLILLGLGLWHWQAARCADPQPYRVEFRATGNGALDSTLKATSQLQTLRTSSAVNSFGLIARARLDVARFKTVLESYGYYQGVAAVTINGIALEVPSLGDTLNALPAGTEAHCRVTFEVGPLYHLGSVDIDGELPDAARGSLALVSGAAAVASDVLAGGARLLTALENQGYAFVRVDPPVAYEDPEKQLLNLRFHVVTGPKVRVGEISFAGLKRVHERLVRRRLLLHTGQPYSALAVEQARKDLLSLGVFSTVSVRLAEAADADGRVPITFRMRERLRHSVALNAGYSSDLGGSAGVTWTDRNVRGNAEQLTLSAQAINLGGTATTGLGYDVSAIYLIPEFAHRDQSLQFAVGTLKQSLQAYDQTAETTGVTLSRKLSSLWSASVGLSAVHETITQQGTTRVYTLFALPLGVLYDSTDLSSPLMDPIHGWRSSFSLAPTLSRGKPNATFFITQASVAKYFDLRHLFGTEPGRSVLAMRVLTAAALGATQFTELVEQCPPASTPPRPCAEIPVTVPDLPPDQRFYAGGSGTVRGYRYQSVGPEFFDGSPVGGTAMNALNLEYRQRIGASLGAAAFVDAGNVSQESNPLKGLFHSSRCRSGGLVGTNPAQSTTDCWAVGVGAGARYYTSIGVLRFDLAVPMLRSSNDDRFEVYIGLGQAF